MAACKKCGAAIVWRRTSEDRRVPYNADDGEVHYGTCRAIALGEADHATYFEGYERTQDAPQRHPVSGRAYWTPGKPSATESGSEGVPEHCCPHVPPWEACEHQRNGDVAVLGDE